MDLQERLLPLPQVVDLDHPANVMTTDTSDIDLEWPSEEAERAKLFIPRTWPGGDDDDATCVLKFEDNRLKIVATKDDVCLDVVDPRDVIGVDLEIKFFGVEEALDRVGFRNHATAEVNVAAEAADDDIAAPDSLDTSNVVQESACDIFKPIGEDMEKIFSFEKQAQGTDAAIPYEAQATAVLNIYCYPRKHPSQDTWGSWCGLTTFTAKPNPNPPAAQDPQTLGHRYPHHRRLEVAPSEDFADIRALVRAIRRAATVERTATPKYLVVVNPTSGAQKNAEALYNDILKPMLEQACVDHDVCVTTHARHAEERMKDDDLVQYHAIVAMGGDGSLHEMLQGIRARPDADTVLKTIKLGVIGCGTGNGLAKSLLHASKEKYSQLESAFLICKGQTSWTDLSVYNVGEKSYTSFLTFTWAMIADVDIESEYIRCLGAARFDLWAVWRIASLRKYRAKLSYLPSSHANLLENHTIPALSEPLPSEWKTMETDFILFWASQVTHASVSVYNSPPSKVQDGVFQIFIIRAPASRYNLIKILLGIETGTHVNNPAAEFIECVAWRLEQLTEGSFNDLDGEVIDPGPVQAKVLPSAIQVFCTPEP